MKLQTIFQNFLDNACQLFPTNYYNQQILLKVENSLSLSKVKEYVQLSINRWSKAEGSKSIRVKIDVDPM